MTEDFDRLPWEPEAGHDYGDETGPIEISHCCGSELREFKCKQYCQKCSRIVSNCAGD